MLRALLVLGLLFTVGLAGCQGQSLTLATTTSTYDTGLLDALLPPFEKNHRVKVKVIAVGTGQALALGQKGDADVLLVHAPEAEAQFMAQGYGSFRRPVMENDFILLGPPQDPAGVRGTGDTPQSLARIAQTRAPFVSRGDNSGTHILEKKLWSLSGVSPPGGDWYFSIGQGMGETLTVANEKGAYTLSDRGTYLSRKEGLNLIVVIEGDERLINHYSVIGVNPERHPQVKHKQAELLADYLTSPQAQQLISQFGRDKYGQPLFFLPGRMR